jgi:acetyl esterase/lipase
MNAVMRKRIGFAFTALLLPALVATACGAQTTPRAQLAPLPAPLGVPKPGPSNDAPYAPLPILPGGVIVALYPPGSPFLKMDRVREAEQYNMSQSVPGRINSIVNIHNPSIEVHTVDRALNTGAAVILVPGGGHNTLNVGSEGADFVPFFYNYGVNTIILRSRLRRDGYNPQTDEVYDAQQSIRLVRAHAREWSIDPRLRRRYLSGPHAFRPQSHCSTDPAQRPSSLHCLCRFR